jgi:diadenosine tetraphosphate (Ap4A) HIT family hydrolase
VPETPEELYARAVDALRMPPVETWETFPFDGTMRPRPLHAPVDVDAPRAGQAGVDCRACSAADEEYIWTTLRWRLLQHRPPSGLPVIVILEPRAHYGEPGDLPDELAAELGLMIARVERAVRAVPHVGRVHVCRWGDGGEHLHWWFIARPSRFPQLIGSFSAVWDDILPPTPEAVSNDNVAIVLRELNAWQA